MTKNAVIVMLVVLLAGCASVNRLSLATDGSPENYLGYQPIDPIPVQKVEVYDSSLNQMKDCYWESIQDKTKKRNLLPIQSAQVAVQKDDTAGKISYLVASLSGEAGSYTVTMDYMKYRVEDIYDDKTGEFIGCGRIGVGLRIKAIIKTSKADLNLGSLLAIGLEAKNGRLHGGLSVDVVGIDSEGVTNLIPLTSEIDQTSIQTALQALASIKTKIFADDTELTPHLVSIRQAKPGVNEKIKEATTNSREIGERRAKSRIMKKIEILSSVAPSGVLDKTKWESLVDKSGLSEESKNELRALNGLNAINERLDLDAAMNGTIISALYEIVQTNKY
jgi:hypothetical protein